MIADLKQYFSLVLFGMLIKVDSKRDSSAMVYETGITFVVLTGAQVLFMNTLYGKM